VGDGLQGFLVVFGYTVFLRSMDWLTTGLVFMAGLREGNPLQAWLLEMGAAYYFAVQWLGILMFALLLWTLSQRIGLWRALLLETGILLYPVIHNATMIVVSSLMAR
jgi:glucose dehydrogenase